MAKYIPTANYLLLTPTPRKEKTDGGLFIPDMSQDKINEGKIIAVGEAAANFTEGETVVFTAHSEYRLKIDGIEYVVVSTDNVILRKK